MSDDLGFTYNSLKDEVHIYHNGKKATVLRGNKAREINEEFEYCDFASQQQLMARLTGNYKRGNEKQARNHPRNRML